MKRRSFLSIAAATAMFAPAVTRGQAKNVIRFVPLGDLAILDPHFTTSYQTRDHAYMVFDTLFGLDSKYQPQPQMVGGVSTEADGRLWRLTLRDGLKFHDGEKVLARDCVASIQRWGKRDPFGQALLAATDELSAADDRTMVFRLKQPFPLLPMALGKSSPSACVIMPERLAKTDAFTQVTEMVGSGPFRYVASERVAGHKAVWERNRDYVPRPSGTADWTAGPKQVHVERVEWSVIPDASIASAALQRGEVDWWFYPETDLLADLKKNRDVAVRTIDPNGWIYTMRLNHLHSPFNNPAIRRVILHAVAQADYMMAMGGGRDIWHDNVGVFAPAGPMASKAGIEPPRNLEASRAALKAAGYNGEKIVLLAGMNIPAIKVMGEVTADLFRKLGLNLEVQAMDWGAVLQRRTKTEPVDQGGWSVMHTFWSGLDHFDPAGHAFLRGNGKSAAFGWPDAPRVEELRAEWFRAPDTSAQQKVAEAIQLQAMQDVPYVPLGQRVAPTAYRNSLSGVLNGIPAFWNVKKA